MAEEQAKPQTGCAFTFYFTFLSSCGGLLGALAVSLLFFLFGGISPFSSYVGIVSVRPLGPLDGPGGLLVFAVGVALLQSGVLLQSLHVSRQKWVIVSGAAGLLAGTIGLLLSPAGTASDHRLGLLDQNMLKHALGQEKGFLYWIVGLTIFAVVMGVAQSGLLFQVTGNKLAWLPLHSVGYALAPVIGWIGTVKSQLGPRTFQDLPEFLYLTLRTLIGWTVAASVAGVLTSLWIWIILGKTNSDRTLATPT
jgi:hypothetical protein